MHPLQHKKQQHKTIHPHATTKTTNQCFVSQQASKQNSCGFVVFAAASMSSCKEEDEEQESEDQEQEDKPSKQHREMEKRERGIHGGSREEDDNEARNGV
jgi:hypothetical protein